MSLRRRILSIGLPLLVLVSARTVRADVPACTGNDPERAASARDTGLTHYRASKHEGPGDVEMATALQSFNEACAAGDDTSLELRAYALAALYKYVDAAQSLDAFLAAHPLDTLDPDVRTRVSTQQSEILSHVTSLDVTTTPPGAVVSLDHLMLGVSPLHNVRLAPGHYEIEVAPQNAVAQTRTVDLAAGPHAEAFDFSEPTLVESTTPTAQVHAEHRPHANLRPWAWGSTIGAGAFAIVGVVGLVYANDRANAYNDFRAAPDSNGRVRYCSSTPTPGGCDDLKSAYGTGMTLGLIGFVGAGVLGATSATLFYFDAQNRKDSAKLSCGPWLGLGATCAGSF